MPAHHHEGVSNHGLAITIIIIIIIITVITIRVIFLSFSCEKLPNTIGCNKNHCYLEEAKPQAPLDPSLIIIVIAFVFIIVIISFFFLIGLGLARTLEVSIRGAQGAQPLVEILRNHHYPTITEQKHSVGH